MKNKIVWGIKPGLAKKLKKEDEIKTDNSGNVEVLSIPDFKPDHCAFSVLRLGNRRFKVVKVDIELSSLQSQVTVLDSVYDNEARAISEMNKLLADQSLKMRKKNENK